jgi:serine protease Do
MLKRLVKVILMSLFVIGLTLGICDEIKFRYINRLSIEGLQSQIDYLTERNNDLLNNNIETGGLVQDLGRSLNKIKNQIKEVDVNYILNGSVFVQSLLGMGSGTIVKKTNEGMYILTAYHVIAENYELSKYGFDVGVTVGYSRRDYTDRIAGMILYGAKIVKTDERNDLALLKTSYNDNNLNEIKVAETNPKIGDIVYSVGNPLGMLRTVSKGILSNVIGEFYISDNTCTYGNSGGGLFNKEGELIGVPVRVGTIYELEGSISPETSLGKSVKLPIIQGFLEDIINGRK